jgi:hypothetical protein
MSFSNDLIVGLLIIVAYFGYRIFEQMQEIKLSVYKVSEYHCAILCSFEELEHRWHYRMDEYANDAIGWQEYLSHLVKEALKENTNAIKKKNKNKNLGFINKFPRLHSNPTDSTDCTSTESEESDNDSNDDDHNDANNNFNSKEKDTVSLKCEHSDDKNNGNLY